MDHAKVDVGNFESLRPPPEDKPRDRESLDVYLSDIRDTPVLSREQQTALAEEMANAEADLRTALARIPETARQIVREWRDRCEKGLVAGAMSQFFRDGSGTDWSAKVDHDLEIVEASLAELEAALRRGRPEPEVDAIRERIAREVEDAKIALPRLLSIFPTLARDADPAEVSGGRPNFEAILADAHNANARLTSAKNEFISHNLRLVIRCAKRYQGRGMPLSDLIQEGNLGLIRAVEKFDHTLGYTFSTYAVWWIEQALNRAASNDMRLIRVPGPIIDRQRAMRSLESKMRASVMPEPSRFALAEAIAGSGSEMDDLRRSFATELSCETVIGSSDGLTIGDRLTSEDPTDPAEEIDRAALRRVLRKMLEVLPERNQKTIEWRFGLVDGKPQTLSAIGKRIGVSRERVRQIEKQSLAQLFETDLAQEIADEIDLRPATSDS